MKKIRKKVFETNSSSSHVLHIDSDVELLDTSLVPSENGSITVYGGEYGWEWDKLTTAYDKISYLISSGDEIYKEEMLIKVIKEQTGAPTY